jgi:ribonucleoside-diphosphate reductase alpha chain
LETVPKKIVKRDGRVVDFDKRRIEDAIRKAMVSVNRYDTDTLSKVMDYVIGAINKKYSGKVMPHVEDVQDIVEFALVKYDLYEVAKAYILYRKERERIREEKMIILEKDYVDEVDKAFSLNAIRLMASRYLLKNEKGRFVEGPKQVFQRIAVLATIPDILYDREVFDKEGGQPKRTIEDFDVVAWAGKISIGNFKLNEHHLKRMKLLYDELNLQGKMKISWSELWNKVSKGLFNKYGEKAGSYYNLMVEKKFLPNSPTLFNAGARLSQLSACFVLDIEDSMVSIMDVAKEAAIIFQGGGGIGINYSSLRPEGDVVLSTGGIASGPVSFMKIIDVITDVIKQGGKRRGANMGILESWHPDLEKFINAKNSEGIFSNFNISVMITEDFWKSYNQGRPYPLVNPRDKNVWKEVESKSIFKQMAANAWKTGDPGSLFKDHINKRNILKSALGEINSTNPCGEEPLYPYESCNLGSINLYEFVRFGVKNEKALFDWEGLRKAVQLAVNFLDNIIDVNNFPLASIEAATKASRKIGLGVMGLADALYALKIVYNSEEGFAFMRNVMEYITYYAMEASAAQASERGSFLLYSRSAYPKGDMPFEGFYHREWWTQDWEKLAKFIKENGMRNSEVTTIAPTGSISMLFDISSGVEPQYALVYEKKVSVGQFFYVDLELERRLKEINVLEDEILKKISDNGGSLQGVKDVSDDIRKVFLVAYDVPWWDHLRAQAEISKWVCAAVSKTINMPNWVSAEDVEKAYLFAYKLGVKGVTIYRDSSKNEQVLMTPTQKAGGYVAGVENMTLDMMKSMEISLPKIEVATGKKQEDQQFFLKLPDRFQKVVGTEKFEKCPECGSRNLAYGEKCARCLECGWVSCYIA